MTDPYRPWITAVIVGLPERYHLLGEALDSVRRQTRPPDDVLVGVDARHLGEAENMNTLLAAADERRRRALASNDPGHRLRRAAYAFLHDDDLWRANHLAVAERHLQAGAEVVVARVRVIGNRPPIEDRHGHDFAYLDRTNWFPPAAVVADAHLFGRWTPAEPPPATAWPGAGTWLDWTNWRRLYNAGVTFADTGETTVLYRFLGGNGSWQG